MSPATNGASALTGSDIASPSEHDISVPDGLRSAPVKKSKQDPAALT
jgi:hypothetical protein